MGKYDDMLYLPRPESRHPRMRRADRAKLFAPFDALNGFGSAIREEDRVLVPRVLQTDEILSELDRKLRALRRRDLVTVIHFISVKRGPEEDLGAYQTTAGTVLRVDELERKLVLEQGAIPFADIMALTGGEMETSEVPYACIQ